MSKRDDLVLNAVSNRVGATGWARGNCPFCELQTGKTDRKQCLGLHVATGKWHCFKCGSSGLLRLVPEDLASRAPRTDEVREQIRAMQMPAQFIPLFEEPGLTSFAAQPARQYWKSRGFTTALGLAARVGVCLRRNPNPEEQDYTNRIILPVFGTDGETCLGWSARDFTKLAERKYLYPPGMRRVLYNHAALFVETNEPAILVEGVLDALAVWPVGVACLGKPNDEQKEALLSSKRPIAVVLDGDAWREGMALSFWLRLAGVSSGYVRLPPEIDPATFPKLELLELAAKSLEA